MLHINVYNRDKRALRRRMECTDMTSQKIAVHLSASSTTSLIEYHPRQRGKAKVPVTREQCFGATNRSMAECLSDTKFIRS